jgi:hypothetical protein
MQRIKEVRATEGFRQTLLAVATLAVLFGSFAQAGSTDGTSPVSAAVESSTGEIRKATLTLEDLKILLGLQSRGPNAVVTADASAPATLPAFDFTLNLSAGEKTRLERFVRMTEKSRRELADQLTNTSKKEVTDIRESRRKLHLSRMSSSGSADEALSRSLFESLLQESNIDARNAKALEAFDADHIVMLQFNEIDGAKVVAAITMGEQTLWSSTPSTRIAKR